MRFDLRDATPASLAEAAACYGRQGYLLLGGLEQAVLPRFDRALADALRIAPAALGPILDGRHAPEHLAPEVLARMSKVPTDRELAAGLLDTFEPLLLRLLGAFVQVSSDFHIQFKSGIDGVVDHGGFHPGHREVQGIHLLHQDFTGASIPTSPSAVTLWVPLNDCDQWTLRMFPGGHAHGLLANEFLHFDDPRLAALGPPLDIAARRGEAVLFNALMMHGSSNPGPARRVSCDLRFFPLTAHLPSEIHVLGADPVAQHLAGLAELSEADHDSLRAPFLETLAFLEQPAPEIQPRGRSVLWWVQYLRRLVTGDRAGARESFERFVNVAFGVDDYPAFERFFDGPRYAQPLERLRARLAGGPAVLRPAPRPRPAGNDRARVSPG